MRHVSSALDSTRPSASRTAADARSLPSAHFDSAKALKIISPSLERRESSPERSIQRQIAAGDVDKWGWVVYRIAYQPKLDAAWLTLQQLVLEDLYECVAESDAPQIGDRMDWSFVEHPELEGASLDAEAQVPGLGAR